MILPGKKSPSLLARLRRWILSTGKTSQDICGSTSTEARSSEHNLKKGYKKTRQFQVGS